MKSAIATHSLPFCFFRMMYRHLTYLLCLVSVLITHGDRLHAQTRYYHGELSDDEQYLLELVNGARKDPAAEARRLGLDLNQGLPSGTISQTPKQPVAFHPALRAAARAHSQWMLNAGVFSHSGAGGSSGFDRALAAGYPLAGSAAVGENLSLNFTSVLQSHEELFRSSAHRANLLMEHWNELGPGIVTGAFQGRSSILGTQLFGYSAGTPGPFITGVVHYDLNGDGAYQPGEGIGGVRVDVAGSGYYAVTSASGGYAVPVPGNGRYTVTFTSGSLAQSFTVEVAGLRNTKRDYAPAYALSSIFGAISGIVGKPQGFNFPPIFGAESYWLKVSDYETQSVIESAENGTGGVVTELTGGYNVITSEVRRSGSYSFHLVHAAPARQTLRLSHSYRPGTSAVLRFHTRMGWASAGQVAKAQISMDGGLSWQSVWSQSGNSTAGDGAFVQREVSLASYQGRELQVRFLYEYVGGFYYNQTSSGFGFCIDDIELYSCQRVASTTYIDLGNSTSFQYSPASANVYGLSIQPRISGGYGFAPGLVKLVSIAPLVEWHPAFGSVITTSSDGWIYSSTYGWLWTAGDRNWIWSGNLQRWIWWDGWSDSVWDENCHWVWAVSEAEGWIYSSRYGWAWLGDNQGWLWGSSGWFYP